jgi:hypothetical protein
MAEHKSLFMKYPCDFANAKPIAMPIYEFLCRSKKHEIEKIRGDWDKLFDEVPFSQRRDIQARFESEDDRQHLAATFEIFLFCFCKRLGLKPELHGVPGPGKQADLILQIPNKGNILLEAQCLFGVDFDFEDKGFRKIQDAIREIESRFYNVELRLSGSSTSTPNIALVKSKISEWLDSLNYEDVLAVYESKHFSKLPRVVISTCGMQIKIKALPLTIPREINEKIHFMYFPCEIAIVSDIHERIRKALHKKARKKYGTGTIPVYIAINVFDFFFDENDIFRAMLGDELVSFSRSMNAVTQPTDLPQHKNNGFWRNIDGKIVNSSINGCIFFNSLRVDNFRNQTPLLINNPSISEEGHFNNIPYFNKYISDHEKGEFVNVSGRIVTELFLMSDSK